MVVKDTVRRLRAGKLPSRTACITFDDGYADNAEVALPILKKYGLSATFFVATGFLDGGRMWNDTVIESIRRAESGELDLNEIGLGVISLQSTDERVAAINQLLSRLKYLEPEERQDKVDAIAHISGAILPEGLMMTSTQVKALAEEGMEIGAHTVSHPILASVSPAKARREIAEGKERLEAITGLPVCTFAYPNGKAGVDYRREHVEMVHDLSFTAAVTTERGVATRNTDRYQLPRFTPWDRTPARFLLRLALNGWNTNPAVVG